jgi:hypothetical protein
MPASSSPVRPVVLLSLAELDRPGQPLDELAQLILLQLAEQCARSAHRWVGQQGERLRPLLHPDQDVALEALDQATPHLGGAAAVRVGAGEQPEQLGGQHAVAEGRGVAGQLGVGLVARVCTGRLEPDCHVRPPFRYRIAGIVRTEKPPRRSPCASLTAAA